MNTIRREAIMGEKLNYEKADQRNIEYGMEI